MAIPVDPALPNVREILHEKQPILDSTERLHNIFSETPVVAFRRSPNLRDLSVRAKNNTLHHPPGTFRCSSRPPGGGVLPYMGYIGTSRGIGYGFRGSRSLNRVSFLTLLILCSWCGPLIG